MKENDIKYFFTSLAKYDKKKWVEQAGKNNDLDLGVLQ